jgi:hypothetical protein
MRTGGGESTAFSAVVATGAIRNRAERPSREPVS